MSPSSTTEFESLTRDNAIKAATSSVTEKATITPTSTLSKLDAHPTPASNLVSSSHRLRSTMIGAIVGGVISLVLILCVIAYFIRRTRKQRGRVGRQFTLLRWRHRCLEEKQMDLEETGTTTGTIDFHAQAKGQPPLVRTQDVVIGSGSCTGFMSRQKQPQTILGEQSPVVSLIQKRETDLPDSIPSALTSSPSPLAALEPAMSPKTSFKLQFAFTPTPLLPAAIHPALHSGQGEHAYQPTAYWPSSCTPEMSRCSNTNIITNNDDAHADAHEQPHSRRPSTTPELFDTGFYLGRVELPTTCSRELINIPFAERQRQRQKSQLHRGTTHLLSITTPDGAVLSPNFNGLPVDTGTWPCRAETREEGIEGAEGNTEAETQAQAAAAKPASSAPAPAIAVASASDLKLAVFGAVVITDTVFIGLSWRGSRER
ncbi:predicted protein [Aspergillus nidulans FGSC A4]|uniref:Uncharacterized protein n=1 Tax=Emericella nidulans (strain FGSC A4 / ATCC 38163 / CBS 112.46 / NRRL 194 / M139) TaxID=227321 RepID=Q5B965_EMENI|nr:hypothetical protein [Aspergillus nidulans FGSC A4]EAA63486.1 predicted protein [Aspergillus nidulans FGSC A4]CBF83755.1 TPA: conserved hypothetical protein [Aspergillus nidulans FGSC A4]|eukprot:XP_660519.1 predicted protein [Aspergillus nidulans FGSC A4]